MILWCLAAAAAPWAGLALPDGGQLPADPVDLLVDDACAGVADGECSLSLRQLRGQLRSAREQALDPQESEPDELQPAERPPAAGGSSNASSASCFVLAAEGLEAPFSAEEEARVRGYFLKNLDVDGSGAVVAAPDHETPGGNYWYHWERDGALSMHALLATSGLTEEVDRKFKDYVQWVKKAQEQPTAHRFTDIRVEPKYEIPSAKPFAGGWCRPQTDGPGLRAKALGEYALAILDQADGKSFVLDNLWAVNSSVLDKRLISWDLDWVVHNWKQEGCDLWEEVVSPDFFWGRYTMRAGLHVGAQLASALGDEKAHDLYVGTLKEIEKTLVKSHWTGAFLDQCWTQWCATRRRDSAVIEAINVGHLSDGYLPLLSKYVLGTVITLNDLFCEEYDVNRADSEKGVPGVLYGRYSGDRYAGGNPWVLLSVSLARLVYRQAAAASAGEAISEEVEGLLQQAYGIAPGLSGAALGAALVRAGDGVLLRVKSHLPPSLHMNEQLDRHTGAPIGAKDLTWNYANTLLALQARSEAVGA